jgi:peptidoglycan-associated lipoprotein
MKMITKTGFTLIAALLLLTGCNYTLAVKDGQTAFQIKRYAEAVPMLEKDFGKAKSRSEKGRIAYQIAEALRLSGNDDAAVNWYKTAYDNNYGPDALRGYAFGLKKAEKYAEAQEQFKNLGIEIGSPYEYRKEVNACIVAQDWKKQSLTSGYSIATTPFNSPQNDFAPVWSADGRIIFTSDRAVATGKAVYGWTSNRFMDLFVVEPEAASAQSFDPLLNTEGNEGTPCFNKKGDEIFFVRAVGAYKGDDQFCKLFISQKEFDNWENPIPLPFQKEKINYIHPCLSPDGNTLYYSANDPEGWGGYDLYSVVRKPNAETGWSDPKLLSRSINTPGNELFPTFDADTLYFASDGLPGMGGLDIFKTYKLEKNAWAPPVNLKSPVNTGADEFGFIIDPASVNRSKSLKTGDLVRAGFFTTNRKMPDSRGLDDIVRFEQRVSPPAPVPKDTQSLAPAVYKMIIEGYVVEKIFTVADDPNSKVLGRKPLDAAKVTIVYGDQQKVVTVGSDGYFRLEAAENTDYRFLGAKENYLNNSTRFSTKGMAKDPSNPVQTYEVEIVLDKIYRNREIVLENIYYDYDKWDIRPDAEPTLNRLAETLTQNPGIRIQMGSHTDCRGNDSYNLTLSQRRAESAVNYLVNKGISAERLTPVGYGEQFPAASCACKQCTEAEHQTNRRTTFKVE